MNSPQFDPQKFPLSLGPRINVETALAAARQLEPHLPQPSALEYLAPTHLKISGPTLFRPHTPAPIVAFPTAVFSDLDPSADKIPEAWLERYAQWDLCARRAQALSWFSRHLDRLDCFEPYLTHITDPVLAGLLLYIAGAQIDGDMREQWFKTACTDPAGAWLAAEGLHTTSERDHIVEAVKTDGRLLWWVSQVSGFATAAARPAVTHVDLYGGMIMAQICGPKKLEEWLRIVISVADEQPDAACAAMILQPGADERDKEAWLGTLQTKGTGQQAYETVRWTRHTWSPEDWKRLKDSLREKILSDGGKLFFHWFRELESEHALAGLGTPGIDPLWASELFSCLGPTADDFPFRYQLGELMRTSREDEAILVLRWLNRRLEAKKNGIGTTL